LGVLLRNETARGARFLNICRAGCGSVAVLSPDMKYRRVGRLTSTFRWLAQFVRLESLTYGAGRGLLAAFILEAAAD
jgi:hypothetical protein